MLQPVKIFRLGSNTIEDEDASVLELGSVEDIGRPVSLSFATEESGAVTFAVIRNAVSGA